MLRGLHMKVRRLLLLLVVIALSTPASGLEWKSKVVEVTAEHGQREVQAVFPFRNASGRLVTITSVVSNCGCMTTGLGKKTFAPGEGGEIEAVFTLGDRIGLQEKSIKVTTDEPGERPVLLWLKVRIPEIVVIEPRVLLWTMGETPAEKSLLIRPAGPGPVALTIARSTNPRFSLRLESTGDTKYHRLWVKPAVTAAPDRAIIELRAGTGGQTQTYVVYALVK